VKLYYYTYKNDLLLVKIPKYFDVSMYLKFTILQKSINKFKQFSNNEISKEEEENLHTKRQKELSLVYMIYHVKF